MDSIVRWVVVTLLTVHGLIHFLGVAKGFGWASVPQLQEPISAGLAVVWLSGGVLVLTAAAMVAARAPSWWWATALLAALVSQIAIATSWSDAKAGTVANVLLLAVAAHGFLSFGPLSLNAQWVHRASSALSRVDPAPAVLVETDLHGLPAPLADHVRRSGAVGEPRTSSFLATTHGRIRSAPDTAWMPFTAIQLNTYGESPQRMFLMQTRRSHIPVDVLHVFRDTKATMQVKALSVFRVVDARGPEMDRAEAATIFQELVVFAPGAIADAPVQWTAIDERRVRGVYTLGEHTVPALLTFDEHGDLTDFVSPGRPRASEDGSSFSAQEWSTPLLSHREANGRRVLLAGEGRWNAPDPEGPFTYLEIEVQDICFNVDTQATLDATILTR